MATPLQQVSPNADVVSSQQALLVNTSAAVGLLKVLQSNLGPTGTLKLLVGGAGQLQLTKDGCKLLKEMQIQHPTAALIARTATAQDDVTGDGTTSAVLLVGELLRQAQMQVQEGCLHPRWIADGYDIARDACLEFLKNEFTVKLDKEGKGAIEQTEILQCVARTSLQTKLDASIVPKMSDAVVTAIQTIYKNNNEPLDLNRVEILTLERRLSADSRLVRGLVLDHGGRHPDMPTLLQNKVYILILNCSLEYEQTETQAGFVYSTAEERESLVESERQWLDERCRQIVQFKRKVCENENDSNFCIINQKGVDPLSLDIFAKEGILCLRRAKRRNLERLTLACGGSICMSLEDLSVEILGQAGRVSQVSYGDDNKYTFVEDCPKNAQSCTLLLQGPNALTVTQMKDAVHDGLRAVKNAVEDAAVVPGGGAFELAASMHLQQQSVNNKAQLGVQAFAQALLIIPKTLAANSGHDVQDALLQLRHERAAMIGDGGSASTSSSAIGWNCQTGSPMVSAEEGVWDCVRVKRQALHLCTVLANQLLLVDEVMRAGKQQQKAQAAAAAEAE